MVAHVGSKKSYVLALSSLAAFVPACTVPMLTRIDVVGLGTLRRHNRSVIFGKVSGSHIQSFQIFEHIFQNFKYLTFQLNTNIENVILIFKTFEHSHSPNIYVQMLMQEWMLMPGRSLVIYMYSYLQYSILSMHYSLSGQTPRKVLVTVTSDIQ